VARFEVNDEFLSSATGARPLVVVRDDVQWGDSATWDVLEHVQHHMDRERLLIALLIRAEDAGGIVERRRRLSRDERYSEVTLRRLAPEELRGWIAASFHQADIDEELPLFLHRQTEANPLLVVQALRTTHGDRSIWH